MAKPTKKKLPTIGPRPGKDKQRPKGYKEPTKLEKDTNKTLDKYGIFGTEKNTNLYREEQKRKRGPRVAVSKKVKF